LSERINRPLSKNYQVLRETWRFLIPYKIQLGIAALALLFTSLATLSLGQGLRILLDKGFVAKSKQELLISISIIIGIGFLMAIGTFTRHYYVSWLGEKVSADMRVQVFAHVLRLHPYFFESNSPGEIQSRITTDTTLIQSVIGSSASIALRNILVFAGGLVFLFFTNLKLSLVVLLTVPLVLFPIFFFGRKVRKLSRDSQDQIANVGTFVSESLLNVKVVQSFNQEDHSISRFHKEVDESLKIADKRIKQRAALIAFVILMVLFGICFVLLLGGLDVLEGKITPGELVAFAFYAIIVASAVAAISEVMGDLQRAAGATERLLELLHSKPAIQEPMHPKYFPMVASLGVVFDSVTFSYPTRLDKYAVKNLNFEVPQGTSFAIVGPSGAGKSTIFELLLRFFDPLTGFIRIEGIDTKDVSFFELRGKIGYVSQTPILFSGSIKENIKFGKTNATDSEIEEAMEKAYVTEFLRDLPKGWNTDLGHLGVRLSGGQRQRIAIARAILKNPQILLLDEATSALDNESEREVQRALEVAMKERTTLVIAHRLSTIQNSNQIGVLKDGELEGKGNYSSLLETSSTFQNLAKSNQIH